jgi:DNA-binding CsgD family transcriptional regulator
MRAPRASIGSPEGRADMFAGTHVSALYTEPAERDRARFAFRREGLQNGDRCLFLVDHLETAWVLEHAARQSSAGDAGDTRHAAVHSATDVCLQEGRFSVDQTASFLADSAADATKEGFPLLRVIVEMGWLVRQPEAVNGLLCYELAVDQVVEQVSAVVMCAYDLHCFGVEMLGEVLATHETVLLDGTLLVNPNYHVDPGDVVSTVAGQALPSPAAAEGRRQRATPGDRLGALTESERHITTHVVAGLTNREIATLLVVSRHTVDAHLKHIYIKLGIHTRVELTVLALHHPFQG